MYYSWVTEPELAVLIALDNLARDIPSLGHSRTLVRCRFAIVSDDSILPPACRRKPSTRRVYDGPLADLERWYAAGQRPQPGPACAIPAPVAAARREFANDMLVLEHVDGQVPALTNFAACARVVRDALMDRWPKDRPVPAWLSGHEPDGTPLRESHLSVVPVLLHAPRSTAAMAKSVDQTRGPDEGNRGLHCVGRIGKCDRAREWSMRNGRQAHFSQSARRSI